MIDLVAKRYVKALMLDRDNKSLENIYKELSLINTAYTSDKFLLIINSTEIAIDKKVELILSFVKKCSSTVENLVKLLADNKRLDIIPSIVEGLKIEIAKNNNRYEGIIYTNNQLSDSEVKKLNKQFSQKFNVTLNLSQNICDYDGIKVEIDGLGVEIGFSKERLKSQMIEHILKAV
jgi:F-type H+-transporting ATPase subunit delta